MVKIQNICRGSYKKSLKLPPRYSIFSGDHGCLLVVLVLVVVWCVCVCVILGKKSKINFFLFFFEKIYRGKLSKLSVSYYVLITKSSFLGHFCVTNSQTHSQTHSLTHSQTHKRTESRNYIAACRS